MWVFTRPRTEHDNQFLLNLDQASRVNLVQLGGRWFIEVTLGTEAVPVASADTREEAVSIIGRLYEGLRDGDVALDLMALPQHAAARVAAPREASDARTVPSNRPPLRPDARSAQPDEA